jgi:hypothetical protein
MRSSFCAHLVGDKSFLNITKQIKLKNTDDTAFDCNSAQSNNIYTKYWKICQEILATQPVALIWSKDNEVPTLSVISFG